MYDLGRQKNLNESLEKQKGWVKIIFSDSIYKVLGKNPIK